LAENEDFLLIVKVLLDAVEAWKNPERIRILYYKV